AFIAGNALFEGANGTSRSAREVAARTAASPAPLATQSQITLGVTSLNVPARVMIDDGSPQPTPFSTSVPRGARSHTIRVEADGFVPRIDVVSFERDLSVSFALAPIASAAPPSKPTAPAPSPAAPVRANGASVQTQLMHGVSPTSASMPTSGA